MGESKIFRSARATGAAAAVLVAAALLTSCSQPGATPGGAPQPTETGPVPVATPVVATSAPVTTPEPVATAPVEATPTPSSGADGRTAVVPFIMSATPDGTNLAVAAIVPEVVEDDGTCTATAKRDGVKRVAEGAAVAASSYTGCEVLTITGLTAGTWQLRVKYASATAAGASAVRTVTVG